jgi:hypothetical protein
MQSSEASMFHAVLHLPGTDTCFDCGSRAPDWGSLGFGILICIDCAGRHRALGVHVTLVRSLNLDSWTDSYMSLLKLGGNRQFRTYVDEAFASAAEHKTDDAATSSSSSVSTPYARPEVLYYREVLLARVERRPPRTFVRSDYAEACAGIAAIYAAAACPKPASAAPTWGKDKDVLQCMVCRSKFSLLNRRHHCRKCGLCVCSTCAPKTNTKPIIEWGYSEPVRHCRRCFQSPMIKFPPLVPDTATDQAIK